MKFDFLIFIADERFLHVANFLYNKNFKVLVFGLFYKNKILNSKIKRTNSLKFAIKNSKNIICSIPFTRDFVFLNAKGRCISINKFLSYLSFKNNLFGGMFTKKILKVCEEKNVLVYDYYKDYRFVINNSIITAEVAVARAILKNKVDMHFSDCLVLGFGNCGKIIANKLKNLSAKVFVCTDSEIEKNLAKSQGFSVFGLNSLLFKIDRFNYIFNTIPKNIFQKDFIEALNENVYLLDIACVLEFFKMNIKKNITIEKIRGIPGKFKAFSSGKLILDSTLQFLKKNRV